MRSVLLNAEVQMTAIGRGGRSFWSMRNNSAAARCK
jgi:hypothetical protein